MEIFQLNVNKRKIDFVIYILVCPIFTESIYFPNTFPALLMSQTVLADLEEVVVTARKKLNHCKTPPSLYRSVGRQIRRHGPI